MTSIVGHVPRYHTPIIIPAIGLELLVHVPEGATEGALTVIETTDAPGFGPPKHRHIETDSFRVLEGRYLSSRRDWRRRHGTLAGWLNAFVNVSSLPARQFIVITPGLDAAAFFTGLGELMRDGWVNSADLNALGRRWNMEVLGPPVCDRAPRPY
jgi:hypothetical protein